MFVADCIEQFVSFVYFGLSVALIDYCFSVSLLDQIAVFLLPCAVQERTLYFQIDGSTLRTLCQQHGPLQAFYLNLGYGQAVVRYGTKDEAAKAQQSLNSCVLGNTTIIADFVSDTDTARLLEQLNAQGSASSSSSQSGLMRSASEASESLVSSAGSKESANQWNGASTVWSSGGGIGSGGGVGASSLWDGTPGLDEHNSLLPGDLLGGQSS